MTVVQQSTYNIGGYCSGTYIHTHTRVRAGMALHVSDLVITPTLCLRITSRAAETHTLKLPLYVIGFGEDLLEFGTFCFFQQAFREICN